MPDTPKARQFSLSPGGTLTHRQQRFVEEYLADPKSGDAAAVRAGYSARTAGVQAHRLLKNDRVRAEIAKRQRQASERTDVTVERTVTEFARIGFSDLRQAFDEHGRLKRPEEWSDDFAAAVASVEVVTKELGEGEVEHVHKLKLWDKNSALEKIGKHLGMLVERKHVTGEFNVHAMADAELAVTLRQLSVRIGAQIPAQLLELLEEEDDDGQS